MRPCRIATTQVATRHLDIRGNLDLHLDIIGEAASHGCELIVFPELSVTGHNGSPDVIRTAEAHDGPIFQSIAHRAREFNVLVAYGFCELFRGTHYNSHALVGPDGLIGLQRKVHASFDEFLRFRQAYEWSTFDTALARIGTLICHDSDFFESWRVLSLRGVELVLLPHANRKTFRADGSLDFDGANRAATTDEILAAQAQLLAEAPCIPRLHDVLARDNGVFAIFSDQVGFDGHSTHIGGAYVVAPNGSLVARSTPGNGTAWIAADLDPDILVNVRSNPVFPLRVRRPETYTDITTLL
jgi:predicted amidohydrolase